MKLVECYSGIEYAERPRALVWNGTQYKIAKIQARWLTPEEKFFRVQTVSNREFILCYKHRIDTWEIMPG